MEQPLLWFFRLSVVIGGYLFFYSIFQYQLSVRMVSNSLYVLVIFFIIHSLVSIVQILPGMHMAAIIPNVGNMVPMGIFQQPNMQASLMATAVTLAFFMVSLPDFQFRPVLLKIALVALVFLSSFALFSSGSRIGLIGGAISLFFMILVRISFLKRKPKWLFMMALSLSIGVFSGMQINDGFLNAYSKFERLSESGKDVRVHVYRIGFESIIEKPFFGHGIGTFQKVFHENAAKYQAQLGGVNLIGDGRYTHPHNEILLWGMEGGGVAILALLIALIVFLIQLYKVGWKKGGAYFALVFPILIHTQVEHPFYVSFYHWFLFLFFSYILFRKNSYFKSVDFSVFGIFFIRVFAVILFSVSLVFFGKSYLYSYKIGGLIFSGSGTIEELEKMGRHPFFTDIASRHMLASLVAHTESPESINYYIDWMENYVERVPDVGVYIDLARMYIKISSEEKALSTIDYALYLYPEHSRLLHLKHTIDNNKIDSDLNHNPIINSQ
ncbi:hypothetical protein LH51_17395 [Nitrincola sp. A-D6]|nr:hypothetical protein LH51_17395 [Nitrincola sp. A-D6]